VEKNKKDDRKRKISTNKHNTNEDKRRKEMKDVSSPFLISSCLSSYSLSLSKLC